MLIQYDLPGTLKRLRKIQGMSQTDLAKISGLAPSAISHFETGRREPCLRNLIILSIALGTDLDAIVGKITYQEEK